ncbi:IS200/IS605 family transposase [Algoriphagus halophilus]|uniref:IS200/IS605 family transposase n=1 Tax=Algoriphagus halophilus TaxID=226505 RepID=UPI00358F28DC
MPNTYSQMYAQCVFAVKYRKSQISEDWESELFAVIGNLIKENGCDLLIINGMRDHVHTLFRFRPSINISKVMQGVKAKSSKWVNESGYCKDRFEWQSGFGCFTYSQKEIKTVFKYIENQKHHHSKFDFHGEYLKMLTAHQIPFNHQYVFNGLI